MTVAAALEIPGFGWDGLCDLLRALQGYSRKAVSDDFDVTETCTGQSGPAPSPGDSRLTSGPPVTAITSLEEELMAGLVCFQKRLDNVDWERNKRIIARYIGLDGSPGASLREVEEAFGLTRERVRQICDRIVSGVKRARPAMPLLAKCIALVSKNLPAEAEDLENQLAEEGLTQTRFRIESLIRAGELFGEKIPFLVDEVDGGRMVFQPEKRSVVRLVLRCARGLIRQFGVATVADLGAQVEERMNTSGGAALVHRVLTRRADFRWLDESSGWFWLTSRSKNRVTSRIKKILAVAGRIHVSELRTGIGRHHKMKGYAPPRRVLLELCRQLPGYRVEGDTVVADPVPDWRSVLKGVELVMAGILKEHGPVMARGQLEARCLGQGMKRSTFYAFLDYSPIIERYAPGVYGLRGADVSPGLVESLIRERKAGKVLVDHGWAGDGCVWIGYRLSEAMIANGMFSVPAPMKRFVNGRFTLCTSDGSAIGAVTVGENANWGLSPLFRRRGGEPGDLLVLLFNVAKGQVEARIDDDSLLEEFQPQNVGVETSAGFGEK